MGLGVLLALWIALLAPAAPADEVSQVDAYLARMRLEELRVSHLERVTREGTPSQRTEWARKLVVLYSTRLLREQDPKKSEDLRRRVEQLLRDHPEAKNPEVTVALLHGDCVRAWELAEQGLVEGNTRALTEARTRLASLVSSLGEVEARLHEQAKRLEKELDNLKDGPVRTARDLEWKRVMNVACGASYCLGWSSYYIGQAQPEGAASRFEVARKCFGKLLPEGELKDLEVEDLNLNEPTQARVVLGRGLAEIAGGDGKVGLAWLALLRHDHTAPDVRDDAGYWVFRALWLAGRTAEAREYAEKEIASYGDAPTRGRVRLCRYVGRTGLGGRAEDRPLGMLALRGLGRMRQFAPIRTLVEEFPLKEGERNNFLLRWLAAIPLYEQAEKSKSPADYRAAAQALTVALDAPDVTKDPLLAGDCRCTLGYCHLQLGALDKAAAEFKQAAFILQTHKSPSAATALWALAGTYIRLAEKNVSYQTLASEALERFKKEYPEHPNARKVDAILAELRQDPTPLEKVPPDDPTYPDVRLRLARWYVRQWWQLRDDPGKGAIATSAARAALSKYLALPAEVTEAAGRLECLLATVDLSRREKGVNLATLRQHLRQAEPLVAAAKPGDPLVPRYHSQRLFLAQLAKEPEEIRREATWLSEQGKGSPYEVEGLLALAGLLESEVKAAAADRRKEAMTRALPVFRRLAQLLGDSPEKLKAANKNAVIASARLTEYALELGQAEEAARQADKLLAAFPLETRYLRWGGLAHYQAGKYEAALNCWAPLLTLKGGVAEGSNEYFEAKYHQMLCLQKTNVKLARDVFKTFTIYHPDLGPANWRERFQRLAKDLGG